MKGSFAAVAMILLSAVLAALPSQAWGQGSAAGREVVIGGSPYPISTFVENDKAVGLDFDIVEMALREAGFTRIRRVIKPWKRVLTDLDAGRVDLVVPMVYTREREEKYLLAPSIRPRYNIVLVKKSFGGSIGSIQDLSGLTVGKCDGYAYQKDFVEAAQAGRFIPGYCLDNEMGLRKLGRGRFDAFMIGEDAALYLVRQMGLQGKFKYTDYRAAKASHVGFRKTDQALFNAYVQGFQAAREKGSVHAAILTWKSLYSLEGN